MNQLSKTTKYIWGITLFLAVLAGASGVPGQPIGMFLGFGGVLGWTFRTKPQAPGV